MGEGDMGGKYLNNQIAGSVNVPPPPPPMYTPKCVEARSATT